MIQIFDDFVQEHSRARASALRSGFGSWRPLKGDLGLDSYAGINFWGDHSIMIKGLWEKLGPIFPNDMFFRVTNPLTDKALVHSDRSSGDFTALVYLSPDREDSGTGFYRHRATGLTEMPRIEDMMLDPEFKDALYADMLDASEARWEQIDFVEAKLNRCVVFDAPKFHCRLPREGYGDSDETSRMVWACHFYRPQAELDRLDWTAFKKEIGLTDLQETRAPNHIEVSISDDNFYIAPSQIVGEGTFAETDLPEGSVVGAAWIGGKRTELGCKGNHSLKPNAAMLFSRDLIQLITLRTIRRGEELTTNYRETRLQAYRFVGVKP